MIDENADALDLLLRRALQARPEPTSSPDLAARARRLASVEAPSIVSRRRLRAVRRAQGVLAGLGHALVVGVIAIAWFLLQSAFTAAGSSESVWQSSSADPSSSGQGWIFGLACALGAVVALALHAAFSSDVEVISAVGARPLAG